MQPITPHLWFDREAQEAAQFYCSVFPDSRITSSTVLYDTPSGNAISYRSASGDSRSWLFPPDRTSRSTLPSRLW